MASNYPAIVTNLQQTFAGVSGIRNCYDYEPDTLSNRLFYFVLADFEFVKPGSQEMAIRWTWGGRFAVEFLTVEKAEQIVTSTIPGIFAAFYLNTRLGGTIADGSARIHGGKASYRKSQGVTFRTVDFVISAVERFPYEYSLIPPA